LVLVLVKFLESSCANLKLRRKLAFAFLSLRPNSVCKNLCLYFHSVDNALVLLDPEFLHQIRSEGHVGEHLRHLVNGVVSTLNFKLLKHSFLSFL
jgi:hypothetical protein